MTTKKTYTTAEAAILLGLGVDGLRTRIKDGRIKAVKDGKAYLITQEEIERYQRERERDKP